MNETLCPKCGAYWDCGCDVKMNVTYRASSTAEWFPAFDVSVTADLLSDAVAVWRDTRYEVRFGDDPPQ